MRVDYDAQRLLLQVRELRRDERVQLGWLIGEQRSMGGPRK